jgi:hypothetical protein
MVVAAVFEVHIVVVSHLWIPNGIFYLPPHFLQKGRKEGGRGGG